MTRLLSLLLFFIILSEPAPVMEWFLGPSLKKSSPGAAFAKPRKKKKRQRIKYKDIRTDYLLAGAGYMDYREEAENPDAEGSVKAIYYYAKMQVKVSYMLLSFQAEHLKKPVTFTGTLPTGEYLKDHEMENRMNRLEFNFGFSYAFSRKFHMILPYTGLSYRVIMRDDNIKNSSAEAHYRHEWFCLPIGMKLQYQLFKNFVAGVDLSYRPMLSGRTSIYTSEIYQQNDPNINYDIYIAMERSWCYRGELPLEYYMFKNFGISIIPWYDYVSFGNPVDKTINGVQPYTMVVSTKSIVSYGVTAAFVLYF